MLTFNIKYLICTIILFVTEFMIAAFMHDRFIRPTFGDFLVVILMYCALKTFIRISYNSGVVVVVLIAYAIEISQYLHLIVHLGLAHSKLAQCILGSGFSWGDMLAYTLGAVLIWFVERCKYRRPDDSGV